MEIFNYYYIRSIKLSNIIFSLQATKKPQYRDIKKNNLNYPGGSSCDIILTIRRKWSAEKPSPVTVSNYAPRWTNKLHEGCSSFEPDPSRLRVTCSPRGISSFHLHSYVRRLSNNKRNARFTLALSHLAMWLVPPRNKTFYIVAPCQSRRRNGQSQRKRKRERERDCVLCRFCRCFNGISRGHADSRDSATRI